MRRKPSGGGYGQHRKPRYQQGGGGQNSYGGNRPRRNYGQAREKYLAQARDAMAGGDRVMAEYYNQHAEHCYRMMAEEGQQRPQQAHSSQPADNSGNHDDGNMRNNSSLPSFITASHEQREESANPPVQNWEERDA